MSLHACAIMHYESVYRRCSSIVSVSSVRRNHQGSRINHLVLCFCRYNATKVLGISVVAVFFVFFFFVLAMVYLDGFQGAENVLEHQNAHFQILNALTYGVFTLLLNHGHHKHSLKGFILLITHEFPYLFFYKWGFSLA